MLRYSVPRYLISAAGLAVLLWLGTAVLHTNATTAALAMLLLVLAVATYWGLYEAIFTSVLAVLGFNFYFLPPIGTFTIADPQNWVALFAFLVTAFTASQLSARAAGRAEEALKRRQEIENLYELSRAILLDDSNESVKASMTRASSIFGIERIVFYDSARGNVFDNDEETGATTELLANVARSGEAVNAPGFSIIPVRFGTRTIGSLALHGGPVKQDVRESIASLLAINYERVQALDRALAAEAARRNESFRSSLLDGLAHDLKTPLTSIRTCVTRLIDIPPKSEEVRQELLSIIDQESLRLQNSITEAIELSRVESGKLTIDWSDVNVQHLMESALEDARDEDVHRYRFDIPPGLTVPGDANLLRAAVKQLLENAWKYTRAGSPIEIAAAANEDCVDIAVADHGPGLGADEVERVFQKFYRGRRNRGLAEGTGMGLAIAKGIIEAHGGSIRAANLARGGVRFTITLPRTHE